MSELQSNNPFRDRTTPLVPVAQQAPSPSRNPFLDINSPMIASSSSSTTSRPPPYQEADSARRDRHARRDHTGERRTENGHRRKEHSEKQTETSSRDKLARPSNSAGIATTSSHSTRPPRPRSNSETSAMDIKKKDDKDRERRGERKGTITSGKPKTRKHLDKIDLLDVTGFATSGAGFHHDGPFDACNPNRNKNTKKAPVLAFAKDSTAMSLTGGIPNAPVYFGDHVNETESFADYNTAAHKIKPSASMKPNSFDPASNIDPIHGYESVGLGSTTFLEGAPASRSAMLARTTSDYGTSYENRPRATSDNAQGNLGRKKSVLQKIRGAYRDRAADQEYAASPPSSPYKLQENGKDYFEQSKENHAVTTVSGDEETEGEAAYLSPLYRPGSGGQTNGTNGLIKRVKSLRVGGGKKRQE